MILLTKNESIDCGKNTIPPLIFSEQTPHCSPDKQVPDFPITQKYLKWQSLTNGSIPEADVIFFFNLQYTNT